MSRFGPDPRAFFERVYSDKAPWDIGAPQPALLALIDEHPLQDPVLDPGCGTGDLAIALAMRGHSVTGVDFSEAAIAIARSRLEAASDQISGKLDLHLGDALRPSSLQKTFGSAVDTGFYHLFDASVCEAFAQELARVLNSGGRYYLLAFATEFDIPNSPRRITRDELARHFAVDRGWEIEILRDAEFFGAFGGAPAIAACIRRL